MHSELPVHVARQSPSHLIEHAVESLHVTVLASPTWILHVALVSHVTVDCVPSFTSQLALAVHVRLLPSPPAPLHSDESLHVSTSDPVVLPLHFAEFEHASAQSLLPHSVLQSAPAVQVHDESAHTQPVPVQDAAGPSSPPHATSANDIEHSAIARSLIARC